MIQIMLIFKVILSNWKNSKLQLIFTILGIAIACTLWSSVDIINNQTVKAQKRSIDLLQSTFRPIIIDRALPYVNESDYVKLRLSGWIVNPVITGKLEDTNITIMGIDFLSNSMERLSDNKTDPKRHFFEIQKNSNDFLFGSRQTLEKIKEKFSNVSMIENVDLPEGMLMGDITLVQRLMGFEKKFTYLEYIGKSLGSTENIKIKNLMLIDDNSAGEYEFISESFAFNIEAFGALSFFVGMFIVYTSIGMAYDQRKTTIRILKVIGINRTPINLCLTIELLIISAVAGTLGTSAGYLLALKLLPDINSTVSTIYNSPIDKQIDLSIEWFFYSLLIAGIGTLLACLTAILKLDQLKPIVTGNQIPISFGKKYYKFIWLMLLIFTFIFYYLSVSTDIKIVNFLFLGSIILIGCGTVPFILRFVVSIVTINLPKKYALFYWLLKDTQKFGKLLYAGYIAFFLALSINIGVHGMVTSFKSTFVIWLENRIFADYYINIANEKKLNQIQEIIKKYDGEIYPIIKNEGRYNTKSVEIYGFKPSQIYEANWPLLRYGKNVWQKIRNGETIFVSEQFSVREQIKIGDILALELNGMKLNIEVGGIYGDYGNPRNQIMMQLKLYKTFFKNQIPSTIAVTLNPNSRVSFFNDVSSNIGLISETIVDPQQVRKISLEIFDNTFKISFQLAIVTLFVAAFTLYTNLISVNQLRKKDLLPLYLVGFSGREVFRLEMVKIFILTNLVSFLSIGMGIVIASILSNLINPSFFGWKIPTQVFPDYWAKIWLVAIVASIFSTILSFKGSSMKTLSLFHVNNI